MSSRIPILVISPWPSFWEGAPGVGCSDQDELHRALTRAGYDVHYLLPAATGTPPPGPPSHFHLGPRPTAWGGALPNALARPLRYFAFGALYTRLARKLAARLRPRLVIGHSYYAARPAVRVARVVHVPSVVHFFGVMTLAWQEGNALRRRLRNWETLDALRAGADRVVILDDGTRGDQAALRAGVRAERLRFWPNGLDKSFRTRAPLRPREALRAEAGLTPEDLAILGVARLVANKRIERQLEALALLPPETRTRLLLLGEGPLRGALEAQARALGVRDRVIFLGARPHDQVDGWLRAADVFVSTSELTNRSLSTLEAMMCGLPCVATGAGATRDVVVDGVTGLVTGDQPRDIAAALRRLAEDSALRAALGRAAFEASGRFPGWEERTRAELELYRELLEGR